MASLFSRTFQTTSQAVQKVTGLLSNISMALMTLMMLFVAADVIGRYFFNRPFKGSSDLIELMMGIAVFFGMAYCTQKGGDARVDVLYTRMPVRLQSALDCFTLTAAFFVYCSIAWRLAWRARGYLREPFSSPSTDLLHIPYWPFLFLSAIGSTVLCLEMLILIRNSYCRFRYGENSHKAEGAA